MTFIDDGIEYSWWHQCREQRLMLGAHGEMLTPSCWRDASDERLLEFDADGRAMQRGADGKWYDYSAMVVEPFSSSVDVLASTDTSTMADRCLEQPSSGALCEGPGVTFPFGPSGVGPLPPPELAHSWLDCVWLSAEAPSDADIVQFCSSALAWSKYQGEFYRFNADGTLDDIGFGGLRTTCRAATVGALSGMLNLFYCSFPPPSRLGTGLLGTATDPYEIRTIAGTDYLLWRKHQAPFGSFDVNESYMVAVAHPLDDDPCENATLPACILGAAGP